MTSELNGEGETATGSILGTWNLPKKKNPATRAQARSAIRHCLPTLNQEETADFDDQFDHTETELASSADGVFSAIPGRLIKAAICAKCKLEYLIPLAMICRLKHNRAFKIAKRDLAEFIGCESASVRTHLKQYEMAGIIKLSRVSGEELTITMNAYDDASLTEVRRSCDEEYRYLTLLNRGETPAQKRAHQLSEKLGEEILPEISIVRNKHLKHKIRKLHARKNK